jgi:hypothetical protein
MNTTSYLGTLRATAITASVFLNGVFQPLAAEGQEPVENKMPAAFSAFLDASPLRSTPEDDGERKLLKARYNAALEELHSHLKEWIAGRRSTMVLIESSYRVINSELELTDKLTDQVMIRKKHLELTKEIEKMQQARFDAGRIGIADLDYARYSRLNVEIHLLRAERKLKSKPK